MVFLTILVPEAPLWQIRVRPQVFDAGTGGKLVEYTVKIFRAPAARTAFAEAFYRRLLPAETKHDWGRSGATIELQPLKLWEQVLTQKPALREGLPPTSSDELFHTSTPL
jgi:hypothetical protein